MINAWLIAKREYIECIRAKSFIVMTVLIPVLMGGLIYGTAFLNPSKNGMTRIAVVSQDPEFGPDLKAELSSDKSNKIEIPSVYVPDSGTQAMLRAQLNDGRLDGYLWNNPAQPEGARSFQWVAKPKSDVLRQDTIRIVLARERLRRVGEEGSDMNVLLQPITIESTESKDDNGETAINMAYGLFSLMDYVIIVYCMNIGRSIIDDKSSRVFEVVLSTVRPEELMLGKVVGIGAVGLTQLFIWVSVALISAEYGFMGKDVSIPLTLSQTLYFVVFFLLGYGLYSSVASALGAMVSSQQELQPMNIFLIAPLFICNGLIVQIVRDPAGLLSTVLSFVPFCTPLIMYARIAMHQPPAWQIAFSIVEMIVSIYAVVWVAARIYRVGILMYGKRPNVPEIVRWLKYT